MKRLRLVVGKKIVEYLGTGATLSGGSGDHVHSRGKPGELAGLLEGVSSPFGGLLALI